MGEDTDGMIESTATLRDMIKGMTGFDIMEDEETFKSIYDIVVGIGEKWKDLSDIQQAGLLEKLAGKTQSNTLASALNNIDTLKEAYNSAEESAGSAMQEQAHFEEGIQYSINQFNASVEALSHTLLDSGVLKWFIDLGTTGVEALDKLTQKLTMFPAIITGITAAFSFVKGKNFFEVPVNAIAERTSAIQRYTASTTHYGRGDYARSFIGNIFGSAGVSNNQLNANSIINTLQKNGTYQPTIEELQAVSQQLGIVGDEAAQTAQQMINLGQVTGEAGLAGQRSFTGLINILKSVGKTALSIGATMLVSFAINEAFKAYDNYIHQYENSLKSFDESMNVFKDEEAKVKSLEEQLDSLKLKISELESIRNLSITDKNTLKDYKEQEASLERQLELERARQRIAGNKLRTDSENVLRAKVDTYDSIDAQAFIAGQSRSSYVNSHIGTSGGEFGKQKTDVRTATKNAMKYYDSLSETYKQVVEDRDELLLKQEDGKEMSKEEKRQLAELEKEVLRYDTEMGDVKQTIMDNYDSIKDLSDAYVLLGDSTSDNAKSVQEDEKAIGDWIIATDEATSSTDEATKAQNEFVHSVVKTSKDISTQKAEVDALAESYKEIAELTSGDALQNVTLDEEQLAKYGKYLEYVNGAYRLNREDLIKNAKANNDLEKTKIELIRKRERDQLIANYKALDNYNQLLKDGQKTIDGIDLRSRISDLQKENEQILSNCKMYDYQISQIENLSSAYQNWLGASEDFHAESFGEMQSASKFVLDRLADGFTGGEKYEAALDLILPDHVDRDDESAIKKYIKDLQTNYFTEDITGSNRFIKEAYDANLLQYDKETGEYSVTEGTTIEDFQKHFKWTTDVTRAMFNELERSRGWKFYWDVDDLDTVRDDFIETRTELDELLQQKEEFEKTPVGERDQEAFTELLEKIAKTRKELIDLDNILQKEVVNETVDTINKNGGVRKVHEEVVQAEEGGATPQEISDTIKEKTGITTQVQVDVMTDTAQRDLENLNTQATTLEEALSKASSAFEKDAIQAQLNEVQRSIETKEMTLELMNNIIFDEIGAATEKTTNVIAENTAKSAQSLASIDGKMPNGSSGEQGTGEGTGKTPQPKPGKVTYQDTQDFFRKPTGKASPAASSNIFVNADTSKADKAIDAVNKKADEVTAPRTMPFKTSGLAGINTELSRAERLASVLTGKTHFINFQYRITGSKPSTSDIDHSDSARGNVFANGNAFARGNDIVGEQGRELVVDPNRGIWYTVGNSGTEMIDLPEDAIVYSHNQTEALLKSGVTTRGKSTGRSFADGTLVGERGRELIVDPNSGIWYTVGDYGSEMINLPKDAIVYNHQQTEDLLKNGHTGRGHSTGASFAEGNAYEGGTDNNTSESINGGGKGKDPNTLTTTASVKAAKSAEKAAKSAEKAAKNAKEDAEDAKESIDWIERALEYQNDQIKKWKDVVDDDYEPYSNRFNALEGYKNQLIEQEEILTEALHRRNEKFEEDSKKLTDAIGEEKAQVILERVLKGDVDPGEWLQKFQDEFGAESGEKIYKIVVDLQTDNKNIESTKDAIHENAKAIRDAEQEAFKMRLNIIKAAKDDLDYEMDVLEHNLDMKDVLGRMVVEADYQEMIDLTDDMADNLREQRDVLEEQLDSLEEGSQEWYNCKQEINSVNKELMECEKNQAEWNDKIMRLPIERIDRYINMLNNIKKDLENWSAEQNVLGIDTTAKTIEQRFDIAQRAIKKYNEQVDKYRDLLSHYEYGSDKFEETANSIQDCEDNVSSLIQEMRELNIQFLKLPIDDITKANEKLQNINAAEQRVLDDYDTALSAVLSKFDQLIDKRNDEIDILNKRYDEMIKPYQDQLDLLNEQNEAKQMQYNIDKAQYDLDKARQQKNVQVVRNGRIEYDSDIDALKSAQDNLNNAKHDKAVYDLQQQIDALEKERDSKIEPLEKEIEKLEDARNRWQTFEDERTFEKEAAEAVRLLGANWEKAIEGTITNPHSDDREYDIFSKNHIQLDRQITNNEKQIENNERMIDLMTRYVDAYMSGEMTYEEARSQYDKLYKDYQSGATLTSQESLAAELAFNRAKDMGDALRLNNAETKKSYDSFLGQLEKANEYNKTIDKYTKTWDEINESITKQLAELERLAALAEEIAAQRRSSGGSRRSGDDNDDDRGEWSKNPTGYGAGTKYNPYGKGTLYEGDAVFTGKSIYIDNSGGDTTVESKSTEVKSSSSSSKSSGKSHYNHSSASGPASDPELHADGLAGGIIGNIPPTEKFKKLQAMGLKPLEPDEVPAFLHVGEGVVNAIQQSNILKSVGNAFKAGVASIPTDSVKSVENNYTFDCQFGDFILPNVEDTNGFANAMKNNFESIMNQQFSKIF